MSFEHISIDSVPAASLTLLDESVLVRPTSTEEVRASGIIVPYAASQNFLGGAFYGEVVAVGPGRLVERGASPDSIRRFVIDTVLIEDLSRFDIADRIVDFIAKHTKIERIPLPWKPGDYVMVKQGFGPEVQLREGLHHIVGRGNQEYGHGIVAAWDPEHAHCWHRSTSLGGGVRCRCGAKVGVLGTRLPACSECPPGERLAEAVLGRKVVSIPIPDAPPVGDYEMRPEDDGRQDV